MGTLEKAVALRLRAVMAEFSIPGNREFGEICGGASHSQVNNWLLGYNLPRVPEMGSLCNTTGTTLDWLYRGVLGSMDAKLAIRLGWKASEIEKIWSDSASKRKRLSAQ